MFSVKNLQFNIKNKSILNIEELKIEDNEKVAIMGLNGSGKTTLIETLIGLNKVKGALIQRDKDVIINAVFQESGFLLTLKVYEIFSLYCDLYKVKEDIEQWLTDFNLLECKNIKYKKLSGGQKQKLKFLISLLNNPSLLILDEISTSLDYVWRVEIIKKIQDFINKENKTLLIISHDFKEISELCNRVILLEKGRIIKDIELLGSIEEKNQILEKVLGK